MWQVILQSGKVESEWSSYKAAAGHVTAAKLGGNVYVYLIQECALPENKVACAMCERVVLTVDSYSPADEALCAACNSEVDRPKLVAMRALAGKGR